MALSIFIAHPSALLTDHEPHGDGLVAYGFVRGIAERGHRLHVAASRVALLAPIPGDVHIHMIGSDRPAPIARLEYMRRLRDLFVRLHAEQPFDLVHQLNPVHLGLTLSLPRTGVPLVLGPYVPAWPAAGWGAAAPLVAAQNPFKQLIAAAQQRRASALLLSTAAARTKIPRHPSAGAIVRELSGGIDERLWPPATREPSNQDILFLANLERRKGALVLLEAFSMLAPELPQVRLLVAGDGSEHGRIAQAVARSPFAERIVLMGKVPREEVGELMRSCAVFCIPSLGEPFGMTALEAMASSRPLVVTGAGGLRFLVDDEGGLRVPPGDAPALSRALGDLLRDPERRRAMGEHNRKIVEQRYSWGRVIDRLEGVYREVTDSVDGARTGSSAPARR